MFFTETVLVRVQQGEPKDLDKEEYIIDAEQSEDCSLLL